MNTRSPPLERHPFREWGKYILFSKNWPAFIFLKRTGLRPCCSDEALVLPAHSDGPSRATKGINVGFLEKPTSLLNTKRVTCAPILVISALVSTDSSVGLTPAKYSLSSAFWMSFYKENNSSYRYDAQLCYISPLLGLLDRVILSNGSKGIYQTHLRW